MKIKVFVLSAWLIGVGNIAFAKDPADILLQKATQEIMSAQVKSPERHEHLRRATLLLVALEENHTVNQSLLYHNLGLAYERLGERGKALRAYLRGRDLNPDTPELTTAIERVRNAVRETHGTFPLPFLLARHITLRGVVTERQLLVIMLFGYVGLWLVLTFRLYAAQTIANITAVVLFLLVSGTSGLYLARHWEFDRGRNAVITRETSILGKPLAGMDTPVGTAYPGQEVFVIERVNGYVAFQTNKQIGWIKEQSLESY